MGNKRATRWFIVLIFVAFAFRVWLIEALPGSYNGSPHRQDGYQYDSLAWNWVQGYGFALNHESAFEFDKCPPCQPTILRTPGYPLFLAFFFKFFGRNYMIVKYVQAVLDILTCWFVYQLSRLVSNNQKMARLAFVIAALLPFTAVWVTDISSETLATFLSTLAVLLVLRAADSPGWRATAGAGIVTGLAILVRPGFALLPLVLLTAYWLRPGLNWPQALKKSFYFGLLVILTLTPWLLRNYLTFQQLVLAQMYQYPEQRYIQGYQKWYLSWIRDGQWTQEAQWNYIIYPQTISDPPFPDYAYTSAEEKAIVETLMAEVKQGHGFSQAIDDQFAALAAVKSRQAPLRYYIILPFWRMIRGWVNTGTASINWDAIKGPLSADSLRSQPFILALRVTLLVMQSLLLPLALLGFWFLRAHWRTIVPVGLAICYHTLIMVYIGYGIQPRYLVYGLPSTVLFVAAALIGLVGMGLRLLRRRAMNDVPDGYILWPG